MSAVKVRVGVVGAGYWGSKHVRTFSALPDVEHVSVIDPSADRLAALTRGYPGLVSFPTLDAALPCLDAVVIATPPSTHAPLALKAIRAGKHVMIEKPLATSVADARMIIDAAQAMGVVVMVGHTFEYHEAVRALRDIVAQDDFGDLFYLDTARLNMGLYQHDVNVIWDLAPHDISILNYVLGSTPTSVECWASRHAHRRWEDIAQLRVQYSKPRVESTVHVSWLHPRKTRLVTAVGSRRMVVFDDLATEERIRIHNKCVRQPELLSDDLSQPPMSYQYGDMVAPYLVVNEPLAVEDEHFVQCVSSGAAPLTGGANGLAVVEVLEAAEVSRREGRRVYIDEVRERSGFPSELDAMTVMPMQRSAAGTAASNGKVLS